MVGLLPVSGSLAGIDCLVHMGESTILKLFVYLEYTDGLSVA